MRAVRRWFWVALCGGWGIWFLTHGDVSAGMWALVAATWAGRVRSLTDELDRLRNPWRAACPCGWGSGPLANKPAAEAECAAHLIEYHQERP